MSESSANQKWALKKPLTTPIRRKLVTPKRKPYFSKFLKRQMKAELQYSAMMADENLPDTTNSSIDLPDAVDSVNNNMDSELTSSQNTLCSSEEPEVQVLESRRKNVEQPVARGKSEQKNSTKKVTSVEEDVEKGLILKMYKSLVPFLRETISLRSYRSYWRGNSSKLRSKIESIPQRPPPIKSIANPDDTTRYYVEQYFSKPMIVKKGRELSDDDDSEEDEEIYRKLRGLPPQPRDSLQKKLELLRHLTPEERRRQKRKWKRRMREEALFVGGNKVLFERHLAELRDYEHQGVCRKLRYEVYGPQVTEKQRINEMVKALDEARLSNRQIYYPNRAKGNKSEPTIPKSACPSLQSSQSKSVHHPPDQNDVTTIVVNRNEPVLIHVEFPGLVNDVNAALQCFGGESKLFETLGDSKRRLEIRLRPWDPTCRASYGDGQTTCGILIKIRRKVVHQSPSQTKPEIPPLIELEKVLPEPDISLINELGSNSKLDFGDFASEVEEEVKKDDKDGDECKIDGILQKERSWKPEHQKPFVTSSGILITKEWLTSKDTLLSDEKDKMMNMRLVRRNKEHEDKYCYLNLPDFKVFKPPESQLEVEVLGVISRQYKFLTTLSDVQFQPFKTFEGRQICTAGKITDVFSNPDGRFPYFSELVHLGKRIPEFIPPISFSRVYKYFKDFAMFDNRKFTADVDSGSDSESNPEDESDEENATSVIGQRSGRPKRLVHTHLFDFKKTDADLKPNVTQVPVKPYDRALIDIRRKGLKHHRDVVAKLFEERPIWTKFALEHATKFDSHTLKYILPGIAYFTITSPWRSAWVRLSYDPRKDKQAFVYQMMDYRVPFVYRSYLGLSASSSINSFSYRAGTVPPKGQIFYQLCEINIPEVEELVINLGERINSQKHLQYDPKWGWVPSETLEYVRYNITRHIELHLFNLGKIPKVYSPALDLHPGEVFPRDKIRFCHNSQNKRIRRKKITVVKKVIPAVTVPHARMKGRREDADDVLEGLPQPIYKQSDDILPSVSMRNPRHFVHGPANQTYNPLEEDRHLFGDSNKVWSSKSQSTTDKKKGGKGRKTSSSKL